MSTLKKIFLFSLIFTHVFCYSQAKFIASGKIEYEKKTNMHAMMEEGFWGDQFKDNMPQFRTTYFDLIFANNQSIYQNGREVDDKYKNSWFAQTNENVIYNNYDSGKTVTQKQVFEKNFLLQDSLVNIEWRITNETRTIAGFECKKAVGKFMDTLYCVAFYTDQILAPGGPEIFSGLPGLILGIGFPRMHYTLYATKLELATIKPADLKMPTKGKKTNRKEMFATIKEATKDWGKDAGKYFLQNAL
jgi:GLPGLI family protein